MLQGMGSLIAEQCAGAQCMVLENSTDVYKSYRSHCNQKHITMQNKHTTRTCELRKEGGKGGGGGGERETYLTWCLRYSSL